MKLSYRFFIFIFALGHYTPVSAQQYGTLVESHDYDLSQNGKPDKINLWLSAPVEEDEPGIFDCIEIVLSGQEPQVFRADGIWDAMEPRFQIPGGNRVESGLIFIYTEGERTLLFLFGPSYGTGQQIQIFEISQEPVLEIFNKDSQFDKIELTDLDRDGSVELLIRSYPELYIQRDDIQADLGTYSPYLIYSLTHPAVLLGGLTQKYNEAHYIWLGPDYDETVKIVYPRDGSQPYLYKK